MSTLPKAIYRFSAIPTKIPVIFFKEIEQIILKFMETHTHSKSKSNIEKKNKLGGITLHDFIMYYKTVRMKTIWC